MSVRKSEEVQTLLYGLKGIEVGTMNDVGILVCLVSIVIALASILGLLWAVFLYVAQILYDRWELRRMKK